MIIILSQRHQQQLADDAGSVCIPMLCTATAVPHGSRRRRRARPFDTVSSMLSTQWE
jgi:hypothetical protein